VRIKEKRFRVIAFAILLAAGLLLPAASYAPQFSTGNSNTPSYAGFSQIDPTRNEFILLGDTRGKSRWEFWAENPLTNRAEILEKVSTSKPAFVINLGDLVLRGASTASWMDFDALHGGIRREGIPYFPILGNHELQGDTEAGLRNYFTRFPHLEGRRWYSFQWKHVGFIMLDSNLSTLTPKQRADQMQWYAAELERFEGSPDVEHVIVCTHQPPYTNHAKSSLESGSAMPFVAPFLALEKTRLFFSGHVHSYERFLVGSKHFVVSGGGGAPRGKLVIDPQARKYQDQFSGDELRFFHICVVEVRDNALAIRVLRLEPNRGFSEADRVTVSP
jgi:hypothetical protein